MVHRAAPISVSITLATLAELSYETSLCINFIILCTKVLQIYTLTMYICQFQNKNPSFVSLSSFPHRPIAHPFGSEDFLFLFLLLVFFLLFAPLFKKLCTGLPHIHMRGKTYVYTIDSKNEKLKP